MKRNWSKLAYVAGPYRDSRGAWFIQENIRAAERLSLELWAMGFAIICPHKNTAFFDGLLPDRAWLDGDLTILARCDLLVLGPRWRASRGARGEREFAERKGIPIYEWPQDAAILQSLIRGGRHTERRKTTV